MRAVATLGVMDGLRVIDPGLSTSVQDLGRPGLAREGVPRGGAMDGLALRVGNRLCGNADGAAGVEMVLRGMMAELGRPAVVTLAGAGAEAWVEGVDGVRRGLAMWTPTVMGRGERVRVAGIGAGRGGAGAAAYLCVGGGVRVEPVLGSASTHVRAGLGGHEGRTLRAGDVLGLGGRGGPARAMPAEVLALVEGAIVRRTLRVTRGAHAGLVGERAWAALVGAEWTVGASSDRMGTRLAGPSLAPERAGRLTSEPAVRGGVQWPGAGELIVLGPDGPTTGGYPVAAVVAGADLGSAGQLAPGERVRFEEIGLERARALWQEREGVLEAALPPVALGKDGS